jgi:hypothetical protein
MLSCLTDTPRLEKPYPRRPFPAAPDLLLSHKVFLGLITLFIGLPLNLFLTLEWIRHLKPLSKPSIAAIVLFYIGDVNPPFITSAIIANCLNLPYGSHHQLRQIFIWWIVQIVVLYTPAMLFLAAWHFSLRGYAYAAWLSTFDEDWTENNKYRLWWKLISFDLWLSNLGDVFGNIGKKIDRQLINFEKSFKLRMSSWFSEWNNERIKLELEEKEDKRKMLEDVEFDDAVVSKLLQ